MLKKWFSGFLLLALLPGLLFSQTIEENLLTLGNLIDGSLSSIESMTKDNELLKQTLENLEVSLRTQSSLLVEQGKLLSEQEESFGQRQQIYEAQGRYLETLQFKSKIYKVSLIVAVPTCIGLGAWLGWWLAGR
jgi:hypothetical protein